jgi:hypothetical protein
MSMSFSERGGLDFIGLAAIVDSRDSKVISLSCTKNKRHKKRGRHPMFALPSFNK